MTSPITIDISKSNNAKEFDSSSLIHQEQMNTAKKWIDELLGNVDHQLKERLHETISVLGTRGSGKTSFILSLLESYRKSEVQVIDIIDPTLIEEKGHVFLNVISSIKKLVDGKIDLNNCDPMHSDFHTKIAWEKSMQRLANGLPSIDGVGADLTEHSWQDPEFIMNRGILAVSAAQDLEKNFHNFLTEGLKILNKKAFLIAFDDIDIDFKKGLPVLETIRKYFTSSNIITIISGELKLFSLGLRNNLVNKLINPNSRGSNKIIDIESIVTEMEGQYLQKVIKPERRLLLTTLAQKKSYSRSLDIQIKDSNGELNIEEKYNALLKSFGIINPYQAKAYSSFLLNLPLRTQIRLFSLFSINEINFGVEQTFISELYEKKVDLTKILGNANLFNIELLNLLINEKYLMEGYQLQPISELHSMNSCMVALSFIYTNLVKNHRPSLIFDYFIRIGYTRNLHNSLGYLGSDTEQSILTPSIEGLIKYSGLKQDGVLRDITGNIIAYLRGFLNAQNRSSAVWAGVVPLKALAEKQKDRVDYATDRIDYVFKNASYDLQILGNIPLTISKFSVKNESIPCYSIYTLISSISELLRMSEENNPAILKKGLQELSQIRSYTMPEFTNKGIDLDEQALWNEGNEFGTSISENSKLCSRIMHWKNLFPDNTLAPYLLGKISTRFFYALQNIQPRSKDKLGTIFHAQIVAFMNAILIEDVKENLAFINININNTVYSDRILINNINAVIETNGINSNELIFSRWVLSCPLLTCYLNPSAAELLSTLSGFCINLSNLLDPDLLVFQFLDKISLRTEVNRALLRKYSDNNRWEELISVLKANSVPHEWFTKGDKSNIMEYNGLIRKNLTQFFEEADLSSSRLRELREYISSRNIEW